MFVRLSPKTDNTVTNGVKVVATPNESNSVFNTTIINSVTNKKDAGFKPLIP
jgi:hypothetical protein